MDADYKFRKTCDESTKEVWDNEIDRIKHGQGIQYWEDRISEAADSSIPIYTKELWDLVEYLDECWDEAKESDTLDKALTYAVYLKSSEYHYAAFEELGGEDRLIELEQCFDGFKAAVDIGNAAVLASFKEDNKAELKELGIEFPDMEDLPKPALKP